MSEALNANVRMQAIRDAARAAATAELDRIVGRDRTAYDAASAAHAAATARVREARAHRDSLSDSRRNPETGRPRRARGVPIDEWEAAHDDVAAAEAADRVTATRSTEAYAALQRQRPANLATAAAAASDALNVHLDALPEAMRAAVEHLEAIRALSSLAGRPITSTVGGDPIAAVDQLVPAIAAALRTGQAERATLAAQVSRRSDRVGVQVTTPSTPHSSVNLDELNARLAARK
uniref:Uncharacterized protein n=1 Tax=Neobacillus citreus TaxID=2833578 RepID=A0A942T056_9BACI